MDDKEFYFLKYNIRYVKNNPKLCYNDRKILENAENVYSKGTKFPYLYGAGEFLYLLYSIRYKNKIKNDIFDKKNILLKKSLFFS
mmetsp:Transcript_24280/g.21547  ORF Transcript_24280/g.21547 Transcript_24280/m.21547 type:complete len:85 (+) Transcript_24280:12-266(+)